MEINIVVHIPIHSGSSSIVCNNCNMWEVVAGGGKLTHIEIFTSLDNWLEFLFGTIVCAGIVLPSLSDPIVLQQLCHLHRGTAITDFTFSYWAMYLLITGSHSHSSFHGRHVSEKYVPVARTKMPLKK